MSQAIDLLEVSNGLTGEVPSKASVNFIFRQPSDSKR
jgi:hypothetical protein